jgi:5'(3')-deoxyribonucleotidase
MSNKTIIIDLDETVVDLVGPWLARYNADHGTTLTRADVTTYDFATCIPGNHRAQFFGYIREPGFFDALPPLPGAIAGVKRLIDQGHRIMVASMPSGPDSARAKLAWVRRHLGSLGITDAQVILGADKSVIRGDIIIDDRPQYLRDGIANGMMVIATGAPWNAELRDDVDLWADMSDPEAAWSEITDYIAAQGRRYRAKAITTPGHLKARPAGGNRSERKPKVIAFLGRAGSGKTTAARYFEERYGAERVSFAAPIKRIARDMLDFSDAQLYGNEKEAIDPRYGFSPRWVLQRLGCGGRDHIAADVWLDVAVRTAVASRAPVVVIDDCRFINEAGRITHDPRIHGVVVRIDGGAREKDVGDDSSETEITEVPDRYVWRTIDNQPAEQLDLFKSELDALHGRLDELARALGIANERP